MEEASAVEKRAARNQHEEALGCASVMGVANGVVILDVGTLLKAEPSYVFGMVGVSGANMKDARRPVKVARGFVSGMVEGGGVCTLGVASLGWERPSCV